MNRGLKRASGLGALDGVGTKSAPLCATPQRQRPAFFESSVTPSSRLRKAPEMIAIIG